MLAASRGSARVGSFRDAAARYANSRRSAAIGARRVGSACAARWPCVACAVAHPVRVAQQAPVFPSAWLQPGVSAAARRTAATVMVVSRGGLPRRSASWYQCLVKPWSSVPAFSRNESGCPTTRGARHGTCALFLRCRGGTGLQHLCVSDRGSVRRVRLHSAAVAGRQLSANFSCCHDSQRVATI